MYMFERVTDFHLDIVYDWLEEPHVKEFWDNSPAHRDDIKHYAEGNTQPRTYFDGIFSDWMGYIEERPLALIMTHEETESIAPDYMKPHLAKEGHTIGLDFMIGDSTRVGQGLAAPTINAFMDFYVVDEDPNTQVFLIDPYLTNPRAIHVYEKAGFSRQTTFIQEVGEFKGEQGVLMSRCMKNTD